ncbi:MAG: M67 family metallopeptidase [Deltaproteobacteria bacterium]|jgi:proteasome lid subunit RPN8/RPN11|nr:M67 family metallopeptidase [Deltaproteobacteria bacterium]MCL5879877.1 M67 family metallopeptidase [Deltaproteobacteria bacterium]MDA8304928.1 M67 family metallopeptidase [Deltaproteobacteria bacterium]
MAIIIPKTELEIIKKHVAEIFPYEACGGLLGRIDREDKVIVRVYPAENRFGKIAWDSFEIEPKDMLEMDKISRKENLEILGFYHSHPNHPAIPSNFDINASWPYYSYVILSVKGNSPENVVDIKSYLMPDKNSAPVSEDVVID